MRNRFAPVLLALIALANAGCTLAPRSYDAGRLQAGDVVGHCQEILKAMAQRDEAAALSLMRSVKPAMPREDVDKIKSATATAVSLIGVLTQDTPASKRAEPPPPTGDGFIAVFETWQGEKGTPFHMSCLIAFKPDGYGMSFRLNTSLDGLRQSVTEVIRSLQAGPRGLDI